MNAETERWLRVENAGTGEIAEYRNGTRRVVRPAYYKTPTQASVAEAHLGAWLRWVASKEPGEGEGRVPYLGATEFPSIEYPGDTIREGGALLKLHPFPVYDTAGRRLGYVLLRDERATELLLVTEQEIADGRANGES